MSIPPRSGVGSIAEALHQASARISGITPRLDAELLMAHALGISREAMLLARMHDPIPEAFSDLVERRAAGEPVAYITGRRGFWTVELAVGAGVLIPRPDSETLIAAAVAHFAGTPGPRHILDLGTGPGTLLLAALAEWPEAHGLGVDCSARALAYAERNAAELRIADRARFRTGDWAADIAGSFDLILCNPPYVEAGASLARELAHEPPGALFAGPDGLDAYRALAPQFAPLLTPDGATAIEIGAGQADAVAVLLEAQGLSVARRRDLGGHERCLLATRT